MVWTISLILFTSSVVSFHSSVLLVFLILHQKYILIAFNKHLFVIFSRFPLTSKRYMQPNLTNQIQNFFPIIRYLLFSVLISVPTLLSSSTKNDAKQADTTREMRSVYPVTVLITVRFIKDFMEVEIYLYI